MPGEKLVKLMQDISKPTQSELTDLVYGEVLEINPLVIKVDNRFTVTEGYLILSPLCQEVSWWRGLIVGDIVRMLRLSQGQLFYVMEREGGITV